MTCTAGVSWLILVFPLTYRSPILTAPKTQTHQYCKRRLCLPFSKDQDHISHTFSTIAPFFFDTFLPADELLILITALLDNLIIVIMILKISFSLSAFNCLFPVFWSVLRKSIVATNESRIFGKNSYISSSLPPGFWMIMRRQDIIALKL